MKKTLLKIHILIFSIFFTLILFSCKKSTDTPEPVVVPSTSPTLASVTTVSGIVGGPKNTVVTVNGSNFTTDLSKITVTVNGKPCTVLSATATSINFQIPVNCGRGNIIVTVNGTVINGPVFEYVYTYVLSSITNGLVGYQDGPIATSKWDEIAGICVDTSNNIYTAAYSKPIVRKITADYLTSSTLAGNGTIGNVNGLGTAARLGQNDAISADNSGNIYYTDQTSNNVKKIDRLGNVTTFIAAPPIYPQTSVVSKQGNVYVLSTDGIAKYSSTGTLIWKVVSHGAGNVDGDSSVVKYNQITFGNPTIDDTEQNLYFATIDFGLTNRPSQLKKLNLQTLVTSTVAGLANVGGGTNGAAASATFSMICGLALDRFGGIYVADGYGNKIRYVINGTVSTIIDGPIGTGTDADGPSATARIYYPNGLALNKQGDLIISGVVSNKVKRLIID